ncbi:dynamin GTPase [Cladophialophora psammophila CBS 110553]|uniref:Dynamin GTPase n=1 Tax=Cladophialophora psammophila CBS 110553 TaxID=1182543 RepID=W9WSG1_9EURO|nr:dynamin GTPase [Cladophialophora psammophila CBS 110553]EXJ67601.1 dynamin GTPase [Cladophialophora psammophila CBS 110553]
MAQINLQTTEHEEILNLIDTLRFQGISRYVDLPQVIVCGDQSSVKLLGIFWAGNLSQSDNDAELVQSLVKSYMKSKRSIILAVVLAKNGLANQVITKLASEIDPRGERTLGIITKPDLFICRL